MTLRVLVCLLLSFGAAGQPAKFNPTVKRIVDDISEARIRASLRKLESFGTRHVLSSQDDHVRGIGAAQRWLHQTLTSYSPRIEVYYDAFTAEKSSRIDHDVELANVVAVLPGTTHKDHVIVVGAHYDSLVLKKGGFSNFSLEEQVHAPGVNDDGSGIAAVLELARVLSKHEFEKTIVFVAFSGEEVGLVGSRHFAKKAKEQNMRIEAMLNNDIIGNDRGGDGQDGRGRVRVFSAGPEDSQSRTLARYFKEIGERYVPSMRVEMIFRADRVSRGGDHTPFHKEGFAAIRLTTATENFEHQHSVLDTLENTSPAYNTEITRLNAAVIASLALAPPPPETTREGTKKKRVARVEREGYGARMQWSQPDEVTDLAGYAVLLRSTTSPVWEREFFVGDVTSHTLPGVSIDAVVLGVRAIDKDGNPSLAAPFVGR